LGELSDELFLRIIPFGAVSPSTNISGGVTWPDEKNVV
jgi:hypothetical protein